MRRWLAAVGVWWLRLCCAHALGGKTRPDEPMGVENGSAAYWKSMYEGACEIIDAQLECQVGPKESGALVPKENPWPFAPWDRATKSSARSPVNVVYIKTPKCASTQGASITNSVARALTRWRKKPPVNIVLGSVCGRDPPRRHFKNLAGEIKGKGGEPIFHNAHAERRFVNLEILKRRVFVWTVIRDPVSRCLSWYYMQKARKEEKFGKLSAADPLEPDPNGTSKIAYLGGDKCTESVYKYTASSNQFKKRTRDEAQKCLVSISDTKSSATAAAARALAAYHFVGIVERFDETLVALARVLGLPVSAVLYKKEPEVTNASPHPSFRDEPEPLRRYVSDVFTVRNQRDFMLFELVNKSLEATVNDSAFQDDLADFRKRQARI